MHLPNLQYHRKTALSIHKYQNFLFQEVNHSLEYVHFILLDSDVSIEVKTETRDSEGCDREEFEIVVLSLLEKRGEDVDS